MAREGEIFTRLELAELRKRYQEGHSLHCPRCQVELVPHIVPRPPGVSYVRRRRWHLCPQCGRSAVLDD